MGDVINIYYVPELACIADMRSQFEPNWLAKGNCDDVGINIFGKAGRLLHRTVSLAGMSERRQQGPGPGICHQASWKTNAPYASLLLK